MRFTFYLIKFFLKAPSDELLQRQKHEVNIDHEEFMTARYTLISESSPSSPRLPARPPPVNQSGEQPDKQLDGQPDELSDDQPDDQSVDQPVKSPDESPDGSPYEPSD